MRRPRITAGVAVLLVAVGCSGGKIADRGAPTGTTPTSAASADCAQQPLDATEIGVTPQTITVTVIADTDNPVRPGLFLGAWKGVKAWESYVNAHGGLACRRVVVKTANSALSSEEARNAVAKACKDSFAMVGTSALFLQDVTTLNGCRDRAAKPTGIPDIAQLQTEPSQQCSPVSFPALPFGGTCPYAGTGPRAFRIATTPFDYYFAQYGPDALHGISIIPKDLSSTLAAAMSVVETIQELGIGDDGQFGMSGLDTQAQYAPIAATLKQHSSTFARNSLDYVGAVFLRKEAEIQGVSTVKVWDCNFQCYDKRLLSTGGRAVEGQYVWLGHLPFEDAGHNELLDAFLQYDDQPDGFGMTAFVAGLMFGHAVETVVAAHGPNGLTRAALLDAIRNTHDFDAGGLIKGVDVGNKQAGPCFVGMQVQGGKFVRVDPPEPGTFDCRGTMHSLTFDPLQAYKG